MGKLLNKLLDALLIRVFGHYTSTFFIEETQMGQFGLFTRRLKFIGTKDEVVGVATSRWQRQTRITRMAVLTRSGAEVWHGIR